jgi:hypothetical protein
LKIQKQSLRKIVTFLNNPEEEGGFWLPNIQRAFVWTEDQVCRLFDSIMREYPISTLLIWKTRSGIRRRKFIDNFLDAHGKHLIDFYVPVDDQKKCLVLDGQQRLQSLFIGLKGSYNGQELFLNILSGDLAAPDDVKYKFAFLNPSNAQFPWIKFKSLVFSELDPVTAAQELIENAGRKLLEDEKKKVSRHVGVVFKTFQGDDGIAYQELDSIENQSLYGENDVVEVFIRANSGGTKLGKSDLLFSLLAAAWDTADDQITALLESLNCHGFEFTRDFVLKTCLTLLDQGARYEVEKFRKAGVREKIEISWDSISEAITDVLDFIRGRTFIQCDKGIPSYLALIPLIYFRHHYPDDWKQAKGVETYLLQSLLAGAFSGQPDQLIDDLVKKLNDAQQFDLSEVFGVIRSAGRALEITEDRLWDMGYGSDNIHLVFNIWYRFNYTPSYKGNLPQIDHIFPQSILRKVKAVNPQTGRKDLVRYKAGDRDQLANCMLLTATENGSGGKSDTPPDRWFADKSQDYLERHLIPRDPELWKLERFEDFIAERRKLIRAKLKFLLVPILTPGQTMANVAIVANGSAATPGEATRP